MDGTHAARQVGPGPSRDPARSAGEPSATADREDCLRVEGLRSALAKPFDLTVPAGGILAVSGASGSGKSLFLRMLADLDPNEGSVRLGRNSREASPGPAWRALVPYVAAEAAWWADTPADNFEDRHREAAARLAERLGVPAARLAGPIVALSTGERHRLALIRALVLDTPALLLDEPTGPLDPVSAGRVESVLRERAAAGAVIVLASHDPGQGERLGARALRVVDGKPAGRG